MGIKEIVTKQISKGIEKKGNKLKSEALGGLMKIKKYIIIIKITAIVIIMILLASMVYVIYNYAYQLFQKDKVALNSYYTITKDGIELDEDKLNEELDVIFTEIEGMIEELGFKNEKQAKKYLKEYFLAVDASFLPYIRDSEVEGIVKIKRSVNLGPIQSIDLQYLWYEDFNELIEKNSMKALLYFSIDPQFNLCIPTYTETTHSDGTKDFIVQKNTIKFQSIIEPYVIPRELLIGLLLATKNPEYVRCVSQLIKDDGYIDLTVLDTFIITTTKEASMYTEHTKGKILKENAGTNQRSYNGTI